MLFAIKKGVDMCSKVNTNIYIKSELIITVPIESTSNPARSQRQAWQTTKF